MSSVGETDRGRPVFDSHDVPKLKTSAAAVFALIFGLSALICVLSLIFAPVALPLALIGLILGIVGIRKAKLAHVTGRGVAITGLVMSILALLLWIAAAIGLAIVANSPGLLDQVNQFYEDAQQNLPDELPAP
jgi:predicted PurR-regulated permease PerM